VRNNRQSDWQIDKNSWYSDIGHTVSNKTVLCSTIVSLAFLQCISQRFLVGGIVLLIILNYGRNIVSRDWLLRRTLRLKHSSLRVRWDPDIANFGPGEVLQGLDVMWDRVQGHRGPSDILPVIQLCEWFCWQGSCIGLQCVNGKTTVIQQLSIHCLYIIHAKCMLLQMENVRCHSTVSLSSWRAPALSRHLDLTNTLLLTSMTKHHQTTIRLFRRATCTSGYLGAQSPRSYSVSCKRL